MKRLAVYLGLGVLAALLMVACHKKSADAPSAPTATDSCKPFDVQWALAVNMAGPVVAAVAVDAAFLEYDVDEWSGREWDVFIGGGSSLPLRTVSFDGHFDHRYRVRVKQGGCWSSWYEFAIGPANPDASRGQLPTPNPQPPTPKPCHQVQSTGKCR